MMQETKKIISKNFLIKEPFSTKELVISVNSTEL